MMRGAIFGAAVGLFAFILLVNYPSVMGKAISPEESVQSGWRTAQED
jgi:hypothetical protein